MERLSRSNTVISELLARTAEEQEPGGHRRRAMERASRAARFVWPEEAAAVLAAGRSLTELPSVGPWLASVIGAWLASEEPPDDLEPPELRRGFLTLAEVRATLAEHGDWAEGLQADQQMHTTWSDGKRSVAEMAAACDEVYGYRRIVITDHSQGLPIANGMDEARLAAQADEIRRVNADLCAAGRPLVVLHGIEMNLSPEGEGDMHPEALARLDLVLGAFHSKLRLTEDQTDRYLGALANPDIHVLAHPRGRRYNFRLGLRADWGRVAEEAAARGKALEIDAHPDRQDLNVELLAHVRTAGGWVSIGTDAHHPDELRFIGYGLATAIRAGIPRDRILNFLPLDEFRAWTGRD